MNRKLAALLLGAAVLVSSAAASCGSPQDNPGIEVEDCDAEDFANREDDCGFTDRDRRKTPGPRRTRR